MFFRVSVGNVTGKGGVGVYIPPKRPVDLRHYGGNRTEKSKTIPITSVRNVTKLLESLPREAYTRDVHQYGG